MSGLAGLAVVAKARSIAGSIPRQVWIGLAVLAVIAGGIWWHKHTVSNARKEGYAAGVKYEGERIAAKAKKIKDNADRISAGISDALRNRNNEENRAIARGADDLRLLGPGKAACPRNPGISSAARGSVPPGQGANAPASEVPVSDGFAAVPWGWLVDNAEQCDLNRSEVLSWREWHRQQSEAWKKIGK